jgi:hypothetical protein
MPCVARGVVVVLVVAAWHGLAAGTAATLATGTGGARDETRANPWPNCSSSTFPKQNMYSVEVTIRDPVPDGAALVSHVNRSSEFNFSFTTAWFPAPESDPTGKGEGLIVRVVECNPNHHSCEGVPHPQWTNAGALAVVSASLPADGVPKINERVTSANVQWPGCDGPHQSLSAEWGAADPRLAYRPKTKTCVGFHLVAQLKCSSPTTSLRALHNLRFSRSLARCAFSAHSVLVRPRRCHTDTHTHTHTHIHTRTHIYTHTQTHTHTRIASATKERFPYESHIHTCTSRARCGIAKRCGVETVAEVNS